MAKITIAGDAVVVTSVLSLEEIKTLEKYAPKALKLYDADEDGNKELVFEVRTNNKGAISSIGAMFNSTVNGEGDAKLAAITFVVDKKPVDMADYVAETYGCAVMRLNAVEEQAVDALSAVAERKAAIRENITIVA